MSGIPEDITIESLDGVDTADVHPHFIWPTTNTDISYFKIYIGDSIYTLSEYAQLSGDIFEYDVDISEEPLVDPRLGVQTVPEFETLYWQVLGFDSEDNVIEQSPLASFNLYRSYVGWNTLTEYVYTYPSGSINPIYYVEEGELPFAYEGIVDEGSGEIGPNGCISGNVGFVDLGFDPSNGPTFRNEDRIHDYKFAFSEEVIVNKFTIQVLDWGDFMPFGTNPDSYYSMVAYAFDEDGNQIDSDELGFNVIANEGGFSRTTQDFGDLGVAGDACLSNEGDPGNFRFNLSGENIKYVEMRFLNRASTDPNLAFGIPDLNYQIITPTPYLTETGSSYQNSIFLSIMFFILALGVFITFRSVYKYLFKQE